MSIPYPDAHPCNVRGPHPNDGSVWIHTGSQEPGRITQFSGIAAVPLLTLAAPALIVAALALTFAALAPPARAQSVLGGRILDVDGAPVAYANVQLLVSSDSSFVSGTIAGEEGRFTFPIVRPGDYRLFVSLIGYEDHLTDTFTFTDVGERHDVTVTLLQQPINMDGFTVEAQRELYEQKGDRLVINLGSSITLSGATALDVLKRSPGVMVNEQSGAISLMGKEGVRVMINDKLSYIPAEGLMQYLAGMSADNIEQIELITTPPASLDAEGNAGFINIVMKRNPDDGLSGSANISGGYGEGEVGSAGADAAYQQGRLSLYGNVSFLWNGQKQRFLNFRRVVAAEGILESPTETHRYPSERNYAVRAGIDYQVDGRTTLGALIATYDNRWSMNALNVLTIKHNGVPITLIRSDNDEINRWRHGMANVNVRRKIGDTGTFSTDLDYLFYHDNNPTVYANTSTDIASGSISEQHLESGKLTPLHIVVAKADYLTKMHEKWEVGAGVKGAFSRFTNAVNFESLVQDPWLADAGLDSESTLREDVLAVYGKADIQINETASLKSGLRYELTKSNLGSDKEENLVNRRFGSLFPSIAYTQKLNDAHQIGVSFARRITRPSFQEMAPFLYFVDPYTFFSGNAALQPAILSSLKVDYTYRSLITSIEYAREDSSIAAFQSRLIPGTNIQVMSSLNFRRTQTVTALFALPFQVTGWWSTQNNIMISRQEVDGFRNHLPVTVNRSFVQLNTTQNIRLPRDFGFEMSGFYQSATLFGIMRIEPRWGINLGLQRALPNNKGKFTLSVDDVFNTDVWQMVTGSPDDPLYIDQLLDGSQRTFRFTYSTRFGDGKPSATRSTASEEESGRVQ